MARPLRILGLADTHLTSSAVMAGCRPTAPDGQPLSLVQGERLLRWIAEICQEREVDLVVHGGDVYETNLPGPAAEAVAINGFLQISEVAPLVVIPGNHDMPPGGAGTHALEPMRMIAPGRIAVADWIDPWLYKTNRNGDPGLTWGLSQPILPGERAAVVFPVPYPTRAFLQEKAASPEHGNALISQALQQVLEHHARVAAGLPRQVCKIVLFHGTMGGARFDDYQIAPAGDIRLDVGGVWPLFDVQVGGHIHLRQPAPGTAGLPGYVGATDRHDFGEESREPGVSLFTFDPSTGQTSEEFIPYPGARRFQTIRLLDPVASELDIMGDLPSVATNGPGGPDYPCDIAYRFKGQLQVEGLLKVARFVRAARARGTVITNACEIIRENRARVEVDREATSVAHVMEAVFTARPDLGARKDAILRRLSELRQQPGLQ